MNPATTSMGGLTVIIPSLRRPHTLHETVASLLRQTAPPEEIILVVPDLTHVDAATLAAPRVRAIPSPVGACHQRNASERATGRTRSWPSSTKMYSSIHLPRSGPRGRSSGVPLGYSQIVNPFFIMQKGTGLSLAEVVGRTGGQCSART